MMTGDNPLQHYSLKGKTVFITGASRGIGKAIALRIAREGANVVIAAKSAEPHPKLPGTIFDTADEIVSCGGRALACQVDIRDEERIAEVMTQSVKHFGGIDALINNASAISLTGTLETPMKRFDLMFSVNVRATFAVSQAAIPYLIQAENPHILNIAPPLNMNPRWFKDHLAYTMSKYGMSMCVLGMAAEFGDHGIAVNALWPKTSIATAALRMTHGNVKPEQSRTPEIMADAAHIILTQDSRRLTGRFLIDEEVLRENGVEDFSKYAVMPGTQLFTDLFLD
ncbi:Short chain dehydrogenase family protein [uncultured Desulfobacterium sp.]|uniref:Short chain dehydrogenase family protein n=1 Tax=uncultured Desulfobacterium sp. TaxID=201089 RepID=A0A445MTZ7_9BACT|nr:Short chain dehydrogenase family protein [uncultured Desulfobacterium sp.]